jgi:hypothetical protein
MAALASGVKNGVIVEFDIVFIVEFNVLVVVTMFDVYFINYY